jgi:biotin carboxyl carrier protein
MLYVAVVQGVERQVEIVSQGADTFILYIDGQRLEVNARQLDAFTLSVVTAEQEAYCAELQVDSTTQEITAATVKGHVVPVAVYNLRRQALRQAQQSVAAHDGPQTIASPMPGKVVAVLVAEGDQVESGQGLVVVEAMKMENELRAPKAGTVRQLRAELGAAVDSGATLCVVE